MLGKISMGYGGVEITDEGLNILTTPQPLSTTDGVQFDIETSKVLKETDER